MGLGASRDVMGLGNKIGFSRTNLFMKSSCVPHCFIEKCYSMICTRVIIK